MEWLMPVLVLGPMAGGVLAGLADRRSARLRDGLFLLVCALTFAGMLGVSVSALARGGLSLRLPGVLGLGIGFQLDGFRVIYGCICSLMWLVTGALSREYFAHSARVGRYDLFCLLTLGATLGVFFSADLYTLFVFFELMSLTSYAMVAHDQKPATMRAAGTYLAVAVVGGLALLMGLMMLYIQCGTLEIDKLLEACRAVEDRRGLYVAGALMLVGFGAKAGMFPLHIWLPKAHPVAPAPASALLSGVLTKTGVFGVLAVSCNVFLYDAQWGLGILMLGTVTMLLGAVLALFAVDLKRTLACSSVSQIGFILVGVGMQGLLGEHNALAVRGTILHMVNHSLIKLALFSAAGVVYQNLHRLNLNDIRGFGRGKPLFAAVFLSGAAGIAGIPLWNGYLSKTLLHESIVEGVHLLHDLEALLTGVEWLFLLSGGLTVAYMTKLCVALFVDRPAGPETSRKRYLSPLGAVVLLLSGLLLPLMGLNGAVADRVADLGQGFLHGHAPDHAVHYFAWENMKGAVISLAIGAVVYALVVRQLLMRRGEDGRPVYLDRWPGKLDLEELVYRPLLRGLAAVGLFAARVLETLLDAVVRLLRRTLLRPNRERPFPGKFLGRFYDLFHPSGEPYRERHVVTRSFSFSLLMFGAGLIVMLVYICWAAFYA